MSVILAAYSENAFKEYHLPSLNNADYSIVFQRDFFHLKNNVSLQMEVLGNEWFLKGDEHYKLALNNKKYQKEALKDSDVIKVSLEGNETLTLIVKVVDSVFHPYKKYRLDKADVIAIGKDEENDIVYDYLRLVSRKHAIIQRTGKNYKIVNKSRNGIYVNGKRIENEVMLKFGDYINIMGLHMVFLGELLAVDIYGSGAKLHTEKLTEYAEAKNQELVPDENLLLSEGKKIYHRAPRNFEHLEPQAVEIEAPPELNKSKPQPMYLTIGPSITMALPMLLGGVMMVAATTGEGGGSSLYMYSGMVMSLSSAVIGVVWTLINMRYQKKEDRQQEKERFEAYSRYLVEKSEEVKNEYENVSQTLAEMYPDAKSCLSHDESRGILWNRNATHKDYLKHRLGIGNIPFEIKIDVPKKRFRIHKDELAEKPRFIKENYETLYDVPVILDLRENNLIGIIGGKDKAGAIEIAKCMSAQIAANNCYTDVKMGFVYEKNSTKEEKWSYAKWLPHVWSEDKKTRYLADDKEQASDVFYELTKIFRTRLEEKKEGLQKPYYVLFISEPKFLEGELLAKYIFEKEKGCGLTTFLLTENYEELPNACDFIIENTGQFQGMYHVSDSISKRQKIVFDKVEDEQLEEFSRHLSALQVQEMEKGGEIPNALTFFEMLNVNEPKEIPVKELWTKNRIYENIKGMVGQKSGGTPCYLDVHEKYHGPHGLVAGTTGSGKSETLQTYMMSLAVNYSPDDIGFFIIDYKGGGMANLFDGLPHMVGQISNLSGNQVKRAMISIKSENRRRQRVFTENGVNNINLYTKLYKNGEASLPIPHLFIIIDEFAELKREEPDFMRELISVAQVGRSLGVHLILATQKPSGTVDDNIWSNSKFRLCLRVQDKQDSNDMLHKPDAAYITQAGRCYLQVGNDEVYELFQSGYSGAVYEEDVSTGNTDIAKLLTLNGRVDMTGNSIKLSQKKRIEYIWIEKLVNCMQDALDKTGVSLEDISDNGESLQKLVEEIYTSLRERKLEYPQSKYNTARLIDFVHLYAKVSGDTENAGDSIEKILHIATEQHIKLPQKKEQTQLDAVKEYLAAVAKEGGYDYHMQLWMPMLGEQIYLEEFEEYRTTAYQKGRWKEQNGAWTLDIVLGKMDDPENQNQMPLFINFAQEGHVAICGNIVSGKSIMMQTMAYALIQKYTPEWINIYALDFSSKMMSAFEKAPHVGGIMYENDLEKIAKFFNMLNSILEERKMLFRGGNYSQYVQIHGVEIPAIVIFIDNYASFKEKTEERYEELLIRISKEGISHGIFLVVSGAGIGMNDITARVCENISTMLCLSLQDKFAYADLLHNNQIEVLPESGVKGRGMALYEGRVLEYQTALAVEAENDYQRMEAIRSKCEEMERAWKGKKARQVPEIPQKPVWSVFRELEDYQQKLQRKNLLPVGYDAANAEVYGIDLSKTYCYTIYGMARTGKTNFLKVCVQAALEKECRICIIDNPAHDLRHYEKEDVYYATDEQGVFDFFQELLPVFKERNAVKNNMLNDDCEEEEIFEVMQKEIPYFIFISDLIWFTTFIYDSELEMQGFLENIIAKGRLHNIYFISVLGMEDRAMAAGYQMYESFIGYKAGIHFGGNVGENPTLNFEYLSYAERDRGELPGIGCLPDAVTESDTTKVVVPLARR